MPRPSPRSAPTAPPVIVWFRDELRVADNRALAAAAATDQPVIPIYIYDQESPGLRTLGGASKWWLDHALRALTQTLDARGARLLIFRGAAGDILLKLARDTGATAVIWSRRYGAAERAVDAAIKTELARHGIDAQSHNDRLLVEPWDVQTKSGGSFRVFTPFWSAARTRGEPAPPLAAPKRLKAAADLSAVSAGAVGLETLALLPTAPDWAGGLREAWSPGSAGAQQRLEQFLADGLPGYAESRDRPDLAATSRLSPHLRFGEIGIRQVSHAARRAAEAGDASHGDVEKFLSELGWREFSYHLLFHHPELANRNFSARFDAFPWREDRTAVRAWQRGRTGVPIVDAGMRELWRTGTMHNRVRMLAASFLVKHLLIDWRAGEAWFWDTLVDADPASNAASWQWVAGSGADAAPYFRIFNPVLQGRTFDPDGCYVRRWVPELARLPAEHVHAPWEAPAPVLAAAGVALGRTYPAPVVDLAEGRRRALAAFAQIR